MPSYKILTVTYGWLAYQSTYRKENINHIVVNPEKIPEMSNKTGKSEEELLDLYYQAQAADAFLVVVVIDRVDLEKRL